MNQKQFLKYLERDLGCVHCGDTETAVPNHRINRGIGGSKKLDSPANIVVLCAKMNGLIESDSRIRNLAIMSGWKLESWQTPTDEPYFNHYRQVWVQLHDDFTYDILDGRRVLGDIKPVF